MIIDHLVQKNVFRTDTLCCLVDIFIFAMFDIKFLGMCMYKGVINFV